MSVQPRQRSGGRSEQVRLAVGRAVLDLLAEGHFPFTTVEVAEKAGVTRRTLYRWWPTHDDLLSEGLRQHVRTVTVPDTGNWAADVREFAHAIAAFAANPVELTLMRIMASGQHPTFNTVVVEHFEPAMGAWYEMLSRATLRGDASSAHDSRTVISTLVSPLFLAPLTSGQPLAPEFVDQLVDLVLTATRPSG